MKISLTPTELQLVTWLLDTATENNPGDKDLAELNTKLSDIIDLGHDLATELADIIWESVPDKLIADLTGYGHHGPECCGGGPCRETTLADFRDEAIFLEKAMVRLDMDFDLDDPATAAAINFATSKIDEIIADYKGPDPILAAIHSEQ